MQKDRISFDDGKASTLLRHTLLEKPGLVKAVTFSCEGGESLPPFTGLNFSPSRGDDPGTVLKNRMKAERFLNCKAAIYPKMNHGTELVIIDRVPYEFTHLCDGIFTNLQEVALFITHADCQAMLIADPVTGWIGAVHAGWRGQVNGIYTKAVELLLSLGSKKENLFISISPSLGTTRSEFINYKQEIPETLWKYRNENYFDLWTMAEEEFISLGVPKENVQISRICTYENEHLFFSHRRNSLCGRNASAIMISGNSSEQSQLKQTESCCDQQQ